MFEKSEFYRLRQMEEGFIGKWKRIPGSGRAEDVCWDRQGHRRVVCTSYTILYNAHLHNFKQCTSAQSPTTHQNEQLHNPIQCTILYNSKQCTSTQSATTHLHNAQATQSYNDLKKVHTVHSSLHSHKIPLKLNFFDAPAIPVPDYYSNPLIQVAHVAYM